MVADPFTTTNRNNNINQEDFHGNEDSPVALETLRDFVSEDTFEWLEDAEVKELKWKKIQGHVQAFQQKQSAEDASKHDSTFTSSTNSNAAAVQSAPPRRVYEWTSSAINPDGYGGIETRKSKVNGQDGDVEEEEKTVLLSDCLHDGFSRGEAGQLTVKFILSDNWQGFGNQVWPASRHLANMFVEEDKCRLLLAPLLSLQQRNASASTTTTAPAVGGSPGPSMATRIIATSSEADPQHYNHNHPLQNLTLCELGAGTGIPSWTAMRCGARVVSLDQAIPGRIRVAAECAQRNWKELLKHHQEQQESSSLLSLPTPYYSPKVGPYDWGTNTDDIFLLIGQDYDCQQKGFDVVIAADCCFMPWFYSEILKSIHMLLSDRGGVAILTFSLHGNVSEEQNWSILECAHEKGFDVDQPFPPQQLTVQRAEMHPRQAFVYTLRLIKRLE